TAAPSFASDNAMPAPIPFDAPVTNATFPSSFPIHQSPRFDGHVPDMLAPHDRLKYMDLGQEPVSSTMDRVKVLGLGRICFQFFAQLQNVVIDGPCTRIVLVSPHFIE